MATYYIDLNAGDDTKDGLSTANAWKTIQKFVSSARTAGDIAKVRANTTQTMTDANVSFTSSGTSIAPIIVKGCDSVDDPWGDASDVEPIFDWNNLNRQFLCAKQYWIFDNIKIINSTSTSGALRFDVSIGSKVKNCIFNNNARGLDLGDYHSQSIENCSFSGNTRGLEITSYFKGNLYPIRNCTFDGGTYGIYFDGYDTNLTLIDCSFGQTTSIGTADIYFYSPVRLITRNCIFDKGFDYSTSASYAVKCFLEDSGGVFQAQQSQDYLTKVERVTDVVRAGGANSSAKFYPKQSIVGQYLPISVSLWNPFGFFKVWLEANIEKTITVYIRGYGWGPMPTADQLYLQVEYYSNATNTNRTLIKSTQVLAENNAWTAFVVTFTPLRTGFVYLDMVLGLYKASSGIYIDIKPIVS